MDTTKLSSMVIASFGDGLVRKSRVSGVKRGVVYLVKLFFESNEEEFSPGVIES